MLVVIIILLIAFTSLIIFQLFYSDVVVSFLSKIIYSLAKYRTPKNYNEIKATVGINIDIIYDEKKKLKFDYYIPQKNEGPLRIVLLFPGGGYVGGTKKNNRSYCINLASKGIAVFCVNYSLSPKHVYPEQIKDVINFLSYLRSEEFNHQSKILLDFENVFIGGDSAGAHLVFNVLYAYYNQDKKFAKIDDSLKEQLKILDRYRLKGLISLCGLISPQELLERKFFPRYLYERGLWLIHGEKIGINSEEMLETSFIHYDKEHQVIEVLIDDKYPKIFLVDCKKMSFYKQATDLVEWVKKHEVDLEITSFLTADPQYIHEFQFNLGINDVYQQEIFKALVSFIKDDR